MSLVQERFLVQTRAESWQRRTLLLLHHLLLSSSILFPSLHLSVTLHPSSIHLRLLDTYLPLLTARQPSWISPSSTCLLHRGPTAGCFCCNNAWLKGSQRGFSCSKGNAEEELGGARLCVMDLLLSKQSWILWRASWTPTMVRKGGRF